MDYIELHHITKIFGEIVANDDVTLSIHRGEVLSILGENGSGKTTLLNVLGGIYQPDAGSIYIDGRTVNIRSPKDAFAERIGMVHQHYQLVEAFNAVENIVLGLTRKELLSIYDNYGFTGDSRRFRFTRIKDSALVVQEMCHRYGFVIEPFKTVADMSIAEKQTVEICKALFRGIDTLILDEPTAVLTPQETQRLFEAVRNMKSLGKTVIIITHKLKEVLSISDRVVVLRKGKLVDSIVTKEANETLLAEMMVGGKVDLDIRRSEPLGLPERLTVTGLTVRNKEGRVALFDASFEVRGGEILGIAGVSGSGQRELLEGIAGLARDKEGTIVFRNPKKDRPVTLFHKTPRQIKELSKQGKFYHRGDGMPIDLSSRSDKDVIRMVENEEIIFYADEIIDITNKAPIEIRSLGIKLSFVPEDRLGMGLVGSMDLVDNMMLRSYRKGKGRLLSREKPTDLAETIVDRLGVATPSIHTEVRKLSGGNIQKVLVGREISSSPKILMVAYPVRGLDVHSSYAIYELLDEQKRQGTAVIYVGEDLDAMLGLTDRMLVLCGGKITGIVDSRTATKEEVGLLMSSEQEGGEAHVA